MPSCPDFSDDLPILRALGAPSAALLGYGGEARVYELSGALVARIMHPGASLAEAVERAAFVSQIAAGARHLPFEVPEIEMCREVEGRIVVIERRLRGTPLSAAIAALGGSERRDLLENFLQTAERIAEIDVPVNGFGKVLAPPNQRFARWHDCLEATLDAARARKNSLAGLIDAGMCDALPDCEEPRLVHFDLFAGNVLVSEGRIDAVIDFGPTAMMGDRRLDLWSAAAYLEPPISDFATKADREQARQFLARRGLLEPFEAARRWIAAYWTFAEDDPKVMAWCRSVLAPGS